MGLTSPLRLHREKRVKNHRFQWTFRILFGVLLVGSLFWAAIGGASSRGAVEFNGQAILDDGTLKLEALFSPPAAEVGDLVELQLTLLNSGSDPVAAEVSLTLPATLQLDVSQLRNGANYNFPARLLSWQPVLNGGGGLSQLRLPLAVVGLDRNQPEQPLPISLAYRGQRLDTAAVLWVGTPPQATFTMNPPRASVGQPIQLQAQLSGSGPFREVWSLGDGRVVPASNPVVVYPSVGTYLIELQASNPLGTFNHREAIVIVPEPAAFFRPADTTPAVNQEIKFTSQSGGQQPLTYFWDFGDGTTSTDANPVHRYTAPGSYQVILTVRNAYGQAQNYVTMAVGSPPVADAIVPETASVGTPITGQAFIDDQTLSVIWDMGDGSREEGEVIQYTYRTSGDYVVTMSASNNFGSTAVSRLVRVSGGSFYVLLPLVINQSDGEPVLPLDVEIVAETIEFTENPAEITLEINHELDGLPAPEKLLWYINEARRQAGVNPVSLVFALSEAAKAHTDDMAGALFTGHIGTDGSTPYERIARTDYREGGYAGEATAWGFQNARDAVQFWLDSPPHRLILLNPYADQVGAAQTINYSAASIWYWTAEFGATRGSIVDQMRSAGVRLRQPEIDATYAFTDTVLLTWSWPLPLEMGEKFVVYVRDDQDRETAVGEIAVPASEVLPYNFGLPIGAPTLARRAGEFAWLVRLIGGDRQVVTESESRSFSLTGAYPTPVPQPTLPLPAASPLPPALPTGQPSPTPTRLPLLVTPTATPLNTGPTNPTGTAQPTASPSPTPAVSPTPSNTPLPTATSTASLPIVGTNPTFTPTPTPAP